MKKRFVTAIGIALLCVWLWYGNTNVKLTEYEIVADIPKEFENFTIVQLSDLHNAQLGADNKNIFDTIEDIDADIIVMTGDMIDSRNTKVDVALDFAKEAMAIAPCYYVTGNHEARVNYAGDEYKRFKEELVRLGITVLENESLSIEKGKGKISLAGINDTGFDLTRRVDYLVKEALDEAEGYKILLAHRPEYFDMYEGADLILSGHAHGGQIRLPFAGGLFAPGQGILPKYDSGIYNEENRVMVVSRGLGNSLFPVRVNNMPEAVVVRLKTN